MSKEHSWGWRKRLVFGLLVVLVPVMSGLGVWQLERAEQKQQILVRWESTASVLSALPVHSTDTAEYDGRQIELQGKLLQQRILFLDNRVWQGQVGYEVLVILDVKASPQYVLLNLGWLPADPDRKYLPDVTLPVGDIDATGRLMTPVRGFTLGHTDWQEGWPQRIQQIDLQAISVALDVELYPQVIRMSKPVLPDVQVGWVPVNMPPERHIGYAFQWFMMSIALTVCLIVFGWRHWRKDLQTIKLVVE
ncbi:SURF1 family protein [Aliamphritea spongicola]|uniref:SURF1 family protein n=1 Tax=Aliamphritea spongicola TaxID=707589 RepID=UPI00196B1A3E|nr:SURF1 family protein [Aliamphritea spongicola]MBN3564759.1 SURF1 family protein [Aliamphritea spongicola]